MHRTACDVGIDGAQIFEVTVALIEIPDINTRENSDEIFTLLGNISVAQTFRYLGNLYEFRFGIFFEVEPSVRDNLQTTPPKTLEAALRLNLLLLILPL